MTAGLGRERHVLDRQRAMLVSLTQVRSAASKLEMNMVLNVWHIGNATAVTNKQPAAATLDGALQQVCQVVQRVNQRQAHLPLESRAWLAVMFQTFLNAGPSPVVNSTLDLGSASISTSVRAVKGSPPATWMLVWGNCTVCFW